MGCVEGDACCWKRQAIGHVGMQCGRTVVRNRGACGEELQPSRAVWQCSDEPGGGGGSTSPPSRGGSVGERVHVQLLHLDLRVVHRQISVGLQAEAPGLQTKETGWIRWDRAQTTTTSPHGTTQKHITRGRKTARHNRNIAPGTEHIHVTQCTAHHHVTHGTIHDHGTERGGEGVAGDWGLMAVGAVYRRCACCPHHFWSWRLAFRCLRWHPPTPLPEFGR